MDDTVIATQLSGPIIAGRFETFDDAEGAKAALVDAGFAANAVSVFFNNPPGRHDVTEIGGDEHADPEAKKAGTGAVAGAAAGAGVGLAALATGPFGVAALAATGAYVGALAGAVSSTDSDQNPQPMRRAAGVMVAVLARDDGRDDTAIRVLRDCGAQDIERATGTVRDGDWTDFNPIAQPQLVDAPPASPTIRNPEAHP
jgi:hypothetical protein